MRSVPSSRVIHPDVERAIDEAWAATNARPGVTLFDGPVCRLEQIVHNPSQLLLDVSTTSYRINVGTNFCHPEFVERFGRGVMANPVGVSAGLLSSDGQLIMGRRNGRVAYYPHMLHPFAGSLEVRDSINLFDDVRRELREELSLLPNEIDRIECVGVVEDARLRHPESIFYVRSTLSADALQKKVLPEEHGTSEAVPCRADLLRTFAVRTDLTPVGASIAIRFAELLDNNALA